MNLTDVYQETRRTIAMARNDGYNTTEIATNILQAIKDAEKDNGRFKGLVDIFTEVEEATKEKLVKGKRSLKDDDRSLQGWSDIILGEKMTIKFDVPFPEKPTDKQIADIEDDINSRIQTLNQKTGATYELEYYMVNVRVVLREVSE